MKWHTLEVVTSFKVGAGFDVCTHIEVSTSFEFSTSDEEFQVGSTIMLSLVQGLAISLMSTFVINIASQKGNSILVRSVKGIILSLQTYSARL